MQDNIGIMENEMETTMVSWGDHEVVIQNIEISALVSNAIRDPNTELQHQTRQETSTRTSDLLADPCSRV